MKESTSWSMDSLDKPGRFQWIHILCQLPLILTIEKSGYTHSCSSAWYYATESHFILWSKTKYENRISHMLRTQGQSVYIIKKTPKLWLNENVNIEHVSKYKLFKQLKQANYCPICCHTKMLSVFFNQGDGSSSSNNINTITNKTRTKEKTENRFSDFQQLQFHHYLMLLLLIVKISFRLQW